MLLYHNQKANSESFFIKVTSSKGFYAQLLSLFETVMYYIYAPCCAYLIATFCFLSTRYINAIRCLSSDMLPLPKDST